MNKKPERCFGYRPFQTLFLSGLLFLFLCSKAFALPCFNIAPDLDGDYVTPYAEYLEDSHHKLSIDDFISSAQVPSFTRFNGDLANFGFSSSTYWVRFKIYNEQSNDIEWLLEVMNVPIEYLDVYIVKNNTLITENKIAPDATFSERLIQYRRMIFPFHIASQERLDVYVKISPIGVNIVNMNLRVWEEKQFLQESQIESIIWGIYYGGILMMVFYNLFIYLTIKDRVYLYYVLYLTTMTLGWVGVAGHGHEFFWSESLFLKRYSVKLFLGVSTVFAALFCRRFLGTREGGGFNDKVILASAIFGFMLVAGILFHLDTLINIALRFVGVVPMFFLIVGFRVYRAGYIPARYFLTSWFLLQICVLIYVLSNLGVLPHAIFLEIIGPLGVWLEAAFLSFALADRIRLLSREKEEAKSKLMQAQIEPHFLFNTLANISSLAETNVTRAKQMLGELDTYLRTILARTREGETTLKQEVELLKAYLEIIKIRMGERLEYKIDIPDEFYVVQLPPLLIQPLVENAIKHGIEPKVEGGEIIIRGKSEDGNLVLEVSDSGIGLSDEWMSGIGLSNIRQRINMLYGRKGRLEIMENRNGGVCSRLYIPVK